MPSSPPSLLSPVSTVRTGCCCSLPWWSRRTRPGRSLTSTSPPERKAKLHGTSRPLATVWARSRSLPSGPQASLFSARQAAINASRRFIQPTYRRTGGCACAPICGSRVHGDHPTEGGGAAEHRQGCKRCAPEEDDLEAAEEDADGAGQTGQQGETARALS